LGFFLYDEFIDRLKNQIRFYNAFSLKKSTCF